MRVLLTSAYKAETIRKQILKYLEEEKNLAYNILITVLYLLGNMSLMSSVANGIALS